MIYIFAIIFSVIHCKFVKYKINKYDTLGYVAYSINDGEEREIPSFNEYLYSKTVELDVSKEYDIIVYYYPNPQYPVYREYFYLNTSSLMQLKEYEKVKKNNNDFNIMFSPKGLIDDDDEKFLEFLKSSNFPQILIISNNNGILKNLGNIIIYTRDYYIYYIKNEFISVKYGYYSFDDQSDEDILTYNQLYSLEKK